MLTNLKRAGDELSGHWPRLTWSGNTVQANRPSDKTVGIVVSIFLRLSIISIRFGQLITVLYYFYCMALGFTLSICT